MLYAWPSSSTPTVAITGMSSSLSSLCTIDGSMLVTSPTKPSRSSRISTLMSPASSPDSPTASEPCWLSAATISRLTLPTSAMRDDVDALGVGDAQAVDELGLLAEASHEVGDLRAAAVHDDRVHARRAA